MALASEVQVPSTHPLYAQTNAYRPSGIGVERMGDAPILHPDTPLMPSANINGPSLIRVPDSIPNRLGAFYLYFADHKGPYIRMAYADRVEGPWTVYAPGTLHMAQTDFPMLPPLELSPEELETARARLRRRGIDPDTYPHDIRQEFTPHIASPEVVAEGGHLLMYFHGYKAPGVQVSRWARSDDGLRWEVLPGELPNHYMRVVDHEGWRYALNMPGQFFRSRDGLSGWERGPQLWNRNQRHVALYKVESDEGDVLLVFFSNRGDAPERILVSAVDMGGDWQNWQAGEAFEVLRAERDYEGANGVVAPSQRSTAYGEVNQLRDPGIFADGDDLYLLYTVKGEAGIALAKLDTDDVEDFARREVARMRQARRP